MSLSRVADLSNAALGAMPESVVIASKRLNELRENWLNPSGWVDRVQEVVPGY